MTRRLLAGLAALLVSAVVASPPALATIPGAGLLAGARVVVMNRMSLYVPYRAGQDWPSLNRDDVRAWLEMTGNTPDAVFGLDSFGLQQWRNSGPAPTGYAGAADSLGASNFRYALVAEMGGPSFSAVDLITAMTAAYSDPYYWRVSGKPVLMTYAGAQLGDAWWQSNVLAPLAAQGKPIILLGNFNSSAQPAEGTDQPANFPHADGYVDWQYANGVPFRTTSPLFGANSRYSNLDASEATRAASHAAGKSYVQGILPYYWAACHPARQYYEYHGGAGMADQWAVAQDGSDAVYLITWNDNSESTYLQPSRAIPDVPNSPQAITNYPHLGYYELGKYYIKRYLTGVAPVIKKDAIFWFRRTQIKASGAPDGACGPIAASQLYGELEDYVDITAATTGKRTIVLTVNGAAVTAVVAAGLHDVRLGPFPAGATLTVRDKRGGTFLASQSAGTISAIPPQRDYGVASGYFVHDPAKAPGTVDASSSSWAPSDAGMAGGGAGGWFQP